MEEKVKQSKVKIQKRKRSSTPDSYYVDKVQLYEAMCAYKQSIYEAKRLGLEKPRIPEYIGKCIFLITKKIATLRNFAYYTFREDMEGDGYENVIKYIDNFDETKYNNPYAYISQIVMFAFIRRIKAEKLQLVIKHKTMNNTVLFGLLEESQLMGVQLESQLSSDLENDYMNDLVAEFDKKLEEKKQQQKDKKKTKEGK